MKRDSDLVTYLQSQASHWGIELNEQQVGPLLCYARILSSYRQANVIGTRDLQEIVQEHILDSLSCLLCEPLRRAIALVDVGAGGGLPGIPLKLAHPEMGLALLEANLKKGQFLRYVMRELSLTDVHILNQRAESVGQNPEWRGAFSAATARALAPLSVVVEYCTPLIRPDGAVIAMKARLDQNELEAGKKAARILGAEISRVIEVPHLPGAEAKQRKLVVIERHGETPPEYPRREGVPRKRPLGSA